MEGNGKYMEISYSHEIMQQFELYLLNEEKSYLTIQKYRRDVTKFLKYCTNKELDKELVLSYKKELVESYKSTSVNSFLAGINHFLEWCGYMSLRVKPLKIQKKLYENPQKEMSKTDYEKLICCAEEKEDRRLSLVIQTICSTGIRVSELQYITVESLRERRSEVRCKGKTRIIFLPKELCKKLEVYCKARLIKSGSVFRTSTGNVLDRSNIWKMMKRLSTDANVSEQKVFPHNLRHLFARTFYKINKDINKLADLLGHSSIETTRIYTRESGTNHLRQLEKMSLATLKSQTT